MARRLADSRKFHGMHFVGVPALGQPLGRPSAEGLPYRRIVIVVDEPQATAHRRRTRLALR